MITKSITQESVYHVLYVENEAQRIAEFEQAFSQMLTITNVASPAEAITFLQQGRVVDLVIINDDLGGLKFLNIVGSARIKHEFSTMILSAGADTDMNVQAEGKPIIDVFPLDFNETALRNRLAYLIRRKKYNEIGHELDNARKQRIPVGKRLFDIIVSFGVLLAISPLLIVVAILIRLDSKGPVFYKSRRIGMGYKLFDMYKFRTMRTGSDKLIAGMASQNMYKSALAEQAVDELCETCRLANTPCQRPLFQDNMQVCEVQVQRTRKAKAMFMKFKEDPRVTRLGKFLRNTSIDELPQLINILKGDMSFVGNRPLPPYEAEKLTTTAYARRFAAPAGLTGLWQVTKRGKAGVSDQERIQLDALYARTYSFKTDLIILIRTVKAVFKGKRMKAFPLVSLITLNYNQAAVTCALLESVQQLTYPAFEVIVVDNHSVENPTEMIQKGNFKNTQVIVTTKNLGFAGGNNVGLREAKGDFFLLLNNDTEVTPDLIERLLEPFMADSTVGVTCPKIRYFQEPSIIQYAGYTPLNQYTGQAWAIGSHQKDTGQFDKPGLTHFAHGAAMMVKRDVVERAGLLPELYFLYYEELDWCYRIQQAGYSIFYQPAALVFHKESMTVGKSNPMKVYYQTRNRILFMRRNVPTLSLLLFYLYYAGLAAPKALIRYSLRGQTAFLKAFIKGIVWHLRRSIDKPVLTTRSPFLIDRDLSTLKSTV